MVKAEHLKSLKKFKQELSSKIPVSEMYLFGSRVHGKPHRWSDFDLVVVSPNFRNKPSFKRALGFRRYWKLDYPVDFLCYTPEEFNKLKRQITLVREAVENGIEI